MTNDKYKMVQDLADGWREKYEDAKQQLVKAQRAIDEHTYWKAKALDLEVKRDIAVSTLEKVKADRTVAQNALAEQCKHTKSIEQERDQLRAQIASLREALEEAMYSNSTAAAKQKAADALAATPEQSLAEYRNKVIEAFVNEFSRHVGGDGEFWLHELQDFAMKERP